VKREAYRVKREAYRVKRRFEDRGASADVSAHLFSLDTNGKNSKSEARNPRQYRNSNYEMIETKVTSSDSF